MESFFSRDRCFGGGEEASRGRIDVKRRRVEEEVMRKGV